MRRICISRVFFPPDSDRMTLGTERDLDTGETLRFVVPPESALRVLTELHRGHRP